MDPLAFGRRPQPTHSVVREELRFLLAMHGTAAIEAVADGLVTYGQVPFPA